MDNRIAIGLKLPPDLLAEVDDVQRKLSLPVTRTGIIEQALREWLDRHRENPLGGGGGGPARKAKPVPVPLPPASRSPAPRKATPLVASGDLQYVPVED